MAVAIPSLWGSTPMSHGITVGTGRHRLRAVRASISRRVQYVARICCSNGAL